tara:strand:- start:450 stop:752 length:303 start_codon:yes stop_codon:yes gene_type:complete
MLDFSRTWLPYLYLYGVGGGIFLIGMYIILRSRSLKPERIRHREWYHILIFGLVYYMGIHGLFTFAALGKSLFAGVIGLVIVALSVHLIFTLIKKPKGSV